MGQFAIVISGVGGHGCSREVKDGESVLGCQRPDCPDCIAREFVRRFKRNNVGDLRAELIHWPDRLDLIDGHEGQGKAVAQALSTSDDEPVVIAGYALVKPQSSSVIDNLVTGVRTGSF
jgi:hypothetical protein